MAFQSDGGIGKARKLVEVAIRDRGIEPDDNRISSSERGVAWALKFGSAAVMIALNPMERPKEAARLRIVSPIVRMETELKKELLLRLLELNGTTLPGVAFGIINNEIVLVAERSVRGLERHEVEEMLAMIGHFADEYDDLLVREYGGVRVCDLD
ncbi:MAG: YbjN domain-containing protein [Deltaproteobacteria bacterium]|nr:YbjN domain-containing protein [Deltaproteobacteria bacterium]